MTITAGKEHLGPVALVQPTHAVTRVVQKRCVIRRERVLPLVQLSNQTTGREISLDEELDRKTTVARVRQHLSQVLGVTAGELEAGEGRVVVAVDTDEQGTPGPGRGLPTRLFESSKAALCRRRDRTGEDHSQAQRSELPGQFTASHLISTRPNSRAPGCPPSRVSTEVTTPPAGTCSSAALPTNT